MLTLIHGDDITKSRNYFVDLKSKFPDTPTIDGQDVDLTTLAQILEGGSFFSNENILFIENFLTKKKASSDYQLIIDYLINVSDSSKVYIWEGKEVDKKNLSAFKNTEVKLFKLPQSLFNFLDDIKPNNGEKLLQLFHDTLNGSEVEAVFYMLVRHFRFLLALYKEPESYKARKLESNSPTLISEIKRMQPWQAQKLTRQAKSFNEEKLIRLYSDLFEIESGYKTGTLSGDLTSAIDIFLLEI